MSCVAGERDNQYTRAPFMLIPVIQKNFPLRESNRYVQFSSIERDLLNVFFYFVFSAGIFGQKQRPHETGYFECFKK